MSKKILLETPSVMENTKLFPSQEETKNFAVADILENKNTFFSIEGGYGSSKSHIATAIGNELITQHDFKCVHFNVWSSEESTMRRQFLFNLINPITNKDCVNSSTPRINKYFRNRKKVKKKLIVFVKNFQ